jgi:hypothetical protein
MVPPCGGHMKWVLLVVSVALSLARGGGVLAGRGGPAAWCASRSDTAIGSCAG